MFPTTNYANKPEQSLYSLTDDILGIKIVFVNVYFIGKSGQDSKWVLIDAGLPGSADRIKEEAETHFGAGTKPEAIVLTHGHFDHVGALPDLLKIWDVPVYAHYLESPYLTGKSAYPPADPGVGGGAMAYMSWMFPSDPINIQNNLHLLPIDGSIPYLPDWKWLHTPGHAPGHVSLFRNRDRVLIAGDAVTTVNQSSAISVFTQKQELLGPPHYFTIDWLDAESSVYDLAELSPLVLGSGHGLPMYGQQLQEGLHYLSENFESVALPQQGRYLKNPVVTDKEGIVSMPVPVSTYVAKSIATLGVALLVSGIIYSILKNKKLKTQ